MYIITAVIDCLLIWISYAVLPYSNTVDSRYLEFQGTLKNTSGYPYLDISDLQTK